MTDFINAVLCRMIVEWDAFKKQERGAVDLVTIVVLMGIAIVLAVFFKNQIHDILDTLFGQISDSAQDAIK